MDYEVEIVQEHPCGVAIALHMGRPGLLLFRQDLSDGVTDGLNLLLIIAVTEDEEIREAPFPPVFTAI